MSLSRPTWLAIVAGVAYGVAVQLAARGYAAGAEFWIMTVGYVFVLPAVLGYVTVRLAKLPPRGHPDRHWYSVPLLACTTSTLCLAVSMLVGWEGSICLIMAAPIYYLLALIGGWIAAATQTGRVNSPWFNGLVLALPMVSAALEGDGALPSQERVVENTIEIAADPATVWSQIVRVPPITEKQSGFFYRMGFPKPIEATLSHEGVGGVRHASFERGLLFIETVTHWEVERELAFRIAVDPDHTPLTTLDPHVTVGGRYFDVLEGSYRIEPLGPGRSRLVLSSRHRISTRFNFYASLWSELLMSDVQRSILGVIAARCELLAP